MINNKAADNIAIEMPGETETEAAKTDRPDLAFEQDFRITMDPVLKRPATERLIIAREMIAMQQRNKQTLMAPIWEERGPKNVGGRTRTVVYDPNDLSNKKVWAGGVGGGLWYCNDITAATPSWNRVNDFWENIAISSIAFDPTNTQIMYVGTGEGWSNLDAQRGAGVWKSSNAGLGFERLVQFSAETPLQLEELTRVNNMLMGFGQTSDDAFKSLKMLGDVAAVSGGNLTGIAVAFGQAAAEGRVMTRDLRQFINNGVPILDILAESMGVARGIIMEMASEGKISFKILINSIFSFGSSAKSTL